MLKGSYSAVWSAQGIGVMRSGGHGLAHPVCAPLQTSLLKADSALATDLIHKRPYVGVSQARSWSPWLVLGAILWVRIAKS